MKSQDNKPNFKLGDRMRIVRKKWGLSQKEMAAKLKIATSTYQYYERNERSVPSDVLCLLTIYKVSPSWLLIGQEPVFLDTEARNGTVLKLQNGPLVKIINFLQELWNKANDKERAWIEVQFGRCFPEYMEWLKKYDVRNKGTDGANVA